MIIPGRCHCGNITYSLRWEPEPSEIPARACSCSFCTKHGGVWTSCSGGALKVHVAEPARVSKYTFGTRTATFHICTRCGVVPVVTSDIAGRRYAVVNVHTFEGIDPSMLRPAAASFDGESEQDRLARRVRHWIADVEHVEAGA